MHTVSDDLIQDAHRVVKRREYRALLRLPVYIAIDFNFRQCVPRKLNRPEFRDRLGVFLWDRLSRNEIGAYRRGFEELCDVSRAERLNHHNRQGERARRATICRLKAKATYSPSSSGETPDSIAASAPTKRETLLDRDCGPTVRRDALAVRPSSATFHAEGVRLLSSILCIQFCPCGEL